MATSSEALSVSLIASVVSQTVTKAPSTITSAATTAGRGAPTSMLMRMPAYASAVIMGKSGIDGAAIQRAAPASAEGTAA